MIIETCGMTGLPGGNNSGMHNAAGAAKRVGNRTAFLGTGESI